MAVNKIIWLVQLKPDLVNKMKIIDISIIQQEWQHSKFEIDRKILISLN